MMWGYGLNWLSMTLMMLGGSLWIVLLVVLAWAMLRWLNQRMTQTKRQPESGPTARELLSQRYVRDEIDATTFEQMRERLGASDTLAQKSWSDGHRPAGESLFDGPTRGSEII